MSRSPTVFEQQREELVREIAVGMEQVLQNINRLNRNMEGIVAVGNEFGSVEALWSQFEHFMGREGQGQGQGQGQAQGTGQGTSPETQGQGHGQSHEGRKEGQSEMQDVEEEEL